MSHYKTLMKLALPIIVGQLGTIITGVADTIMVGQHSTQELAASAFVINVFNFFMVFGVGFTFNFTPLVSTCLAQDDKKGIGEWLKNSFVVNALLTLFLVIPLLLIYVNIDRMGQPEELLSLIKPYFSIYGISIIPIIFYTTYRQFVETIMQPAISMWIFLIGNIVNIIGNYVLIYGEFGMPELGLYGAGISTLISRCLMLVSFVIVVAVLPRYREYRLGFWVGSISKSKISQMFKLGLPIGVQQGFEIATFSVIAVMVGWLGFVELAAHQIAVTIAAVCYMLYLGLANAVAIRVSFFKGKNDFLSVKKTTYSGVVLGFILASMLAAILFFWSEEISFFFSDAVEVAKVVVKLLPILMLFVFFDATQIVLSNALRGLADVKVMMYIAAVAYFVVAIPAGYFFGFVIGMEIYGLWLAYPIGFMFACAVFFMRFRQYCNVKL